jgi:Ca-activated chloride channel family protein
VTLDVRVDRTRIRERSRSSRFALLRFTAPPAPRGQDRPAVNVAFALDRSWSMRGRKVELVKEAVAQAIGSLGAQDRFAVVLFHKRAKLLAKSTQATDEAKAQAIAALREAETRTGTDLAAGWLAACEQVAEQLDPERVGRCILLTDGEANRGITDRAELAHHAAQLRGRGVSTSTMGVGERFDERLLEALADAGGGHFHFLESADRIGEVMADELEETLSVSVRDAAVLVTAPEGVVVESLEGLPVSGGGGRLRVGLGDLVGDQVVSLVLRLQFPRAGESGRHVSVGFALADRAGLLSGEAEKREVAAGE